ncbi:hypothetical protein BMB171_C0072 [Bacillus thuringiensis BMB171]|nr:hypothetical protein BMB171_C0072 [Bacillus thuringiensis BMB171]
MFYLFNNIPIRFSFIHLHSCTSVNRHSLATSTLNSPSIFYCENMFFIPTDTHFNCNRLFYSIYNRCYHFIYFIRI